MLTGPIAQDNLAFRISVDKQERESDVQLMPYAPVGNPRHIETTTARLKLLFTPTSLPEFSSRFTLNYSQSRTPQNEAKDNAGSSLYARSRPVFETNATSSMWDTSWQFAPNWTWENKLVHTRYGNERLSLPMPNGTPATLNGHEWQLEPILRYHSDTGHLKTLLGMHLFTAKQDETVDFLGARQIYADRTRNQALFGEVHWQFAPNWSATIAGRFEREHHTRTGGTGHVQLNRDAATTAFLPRFEIAWQKNTNTNMGLRLTRGFNAGGAGATFAAPFKNYTYRPEYVWNIEWFSRWRLPEEGLTLNSNVFFNQYKDMQFMYYNTPRSVEVRNADKVHTYGAELALALQATPQLSLHGAVGLLKTRVLRHPDSTIQGKSLSRAPNYTATIGADYRFANRWELGGQMHFSGSYHSNIQNSATGKINAYNQTNLYAAYRFQHGRISLYANNVFNKRHDIFIPANDRNDALTQRARTVGIATELRF